MAYRKATLRKLPPVTRKLARLIGELDSLSRRAKNLLAEVEHLELDSRALRNAKQAAFQDQHQECMEQLESAIP